MPATGPATAASPPPESAPEVEPAPDPELDPDDEPAPELEPDPDPDPDPEPDSPPSLDTEPELPLAPVPESERASEPPELVDPVTGAPELDELPDRPAFGDPEWLEQPTTIAAATKVAPWMVGSDLMIPPTRDHPVRVRAERPRERA